MNPPVLQSHIAGRWIGQSPSQVLRSAVNGAPVAATHAEAIDFAEALEHGLGVATHAEGGVDVESAGARERGGESVEDLGEHDGHVTIGCEAA